MRTDISAVDMLGMVINRTNKRLIDDRILTSPVAWYPEQLPAIHNILLLSKQDPNRFPAIMCLMDMPEREQIYAGKVTTRTAKAHFLLVSPSNPNPVMPVQEREEKVYKPVLYPMYDYFISSFGQISGISIVSSEIERINRYRMSASFNEAARSQGLEALFNDSLDGIEIRNLEIKINLAQCHKYITLNEKQ